MKANLTYNQIRDLVADAVVYRKCGFKKEEAVDMVCEYYKQYSDYKEIVNRVSILLFCFCQCDLMGMVG